MDRPGGGCRGSGGAGRGGASMGGMTPGSAGASRWARAALVCVLATGMTAPPLAAQTPPPAGAPARADSGPPLFRPEPVRVHTGRPADEPLFTTRDAWLALGFVATTAAMAPLDVTLARALQDSTLQVHGDLRSLAGALRFLGFPGTAIIGSSMYAVGRLADLPPLAAVGLHGTEAVVVSYAFVWAGKNLLGRARPYNDTGDPFDFGFGRGFRGGTAYRSLPSGHAAAAFAAAAAVTAETRVLWPEATPYAAGILYPGALLVGVSRMYHNRHWASDVAAGAAIGTFSGLKVIHYHYRDPDNAIDRWLLPSAVVPSEAGLMFIWEVPLP